MNLTMPKDRKCLWIVGVGVVIILSLGEILTNKYESI